MSIPFLDLRAQYRAIRDEVNPAVQELMESGGFIGGEPVARFEQEFADYCEAGDCAVVNSGTDALRLALVAMGLRPGDEVITVPNTFIATTEAISQAGGKIVFCDVDPQTMQMDVEAVERAISPRTRFIIPVHLTGLCVEMDSLLDLAGRHDIQVLEDACQAHGSRYRQRRAGSMGKAGCFSFYPGKNLGAFGEGGAVVSDDKELIARIRMLRDHGQSEKYVHVVEGCNSRLDAIQTAILRVKLRRLEAWNAARRDHASLYNRLLEDLPIERPVVPEHCESNYHLYIIRSDRREQLKAVFGRHGIGWGLHYPIPLHLQQAYAGMGHGPGSYPVAEKLASRIFSLPMFAELTSEQVHAVAEAVKEAHTA